MSRVFAPADLRLDRLQEAVVGCGTFVVLVGRDGVRRWIGAETQVALNRYFAPHDDALRLPIFPILLEGTEAETLPAFLRLFQMTPRSRCAARTAARRHPRADDRRRQDSRIRGLPVRRARRLPHRPGTPVLRSVEGDAGRACLLLRHPPGAFSSRIPLLVSKRAQTVWKRSGEWHLTVSDPGERSPFPGTA